MRPCLPQRRLGHPRRGLKRVEYLFEGHAASLPAAKIEFQAKRLATSTANSHPVDEAALVPTGSGIWPSMLQSELRQRLVPCRIADVEQHDMRQTTPSLVYGIRLPNNLQHVSPVISWTGRNVRNVTVVAQHRGQGCPSRYARLRRGFVPRPMAFAILLRFFA